MTLPTVANVKDWLRIESTAEDALLAELLTQAEGEIEFACGKALEHRAVVWYDDATTQRIGEGVVNLILQQVPIDPATLVVKDCLGVTVDANSYVLRQDKGMICAYPVGQGSFIGGPFTTFDNGPYQIACEAGFDCSDTYAYVELPMIRRAIIAYVAYLYQQRTPGAKTERSAGTTVDYVIDEKTGLPMFIARQVQKLRGIVYGR